MSRAQRRGTAMHLLAAVGALGLLTGALAVPTLAPAESPAYAAPGRGRAVSSAACPALVPPTGPTISVATVSELQSAVNGASSGDTILVADGTYHLDGVYLRFDVPNVTLRSTSGQREAVVLDGNYVTTEIVQIVASNVTIADLTLREATHHPIHVMSSSSGDTTGTLVYNVHIVDPGEQAIKINPYAGADADYFPDDGVIACSHIELTDAGREHIRNNCYTGGVDAHQARGWAIRDNLIEGFWCQSGLSEHAVHLWRACRDTLVERNELRDNARGIGFGLATSGDGVRTYPDDPCPGAEGGYVDHYDGIIRNNVVFVGRSELFASQYGFDCGICLWNACDAQVVHNTVASTQAPFSSIEWRFDHTDVEITNNLVSHNLRDRGGAAHLSGNLEDHPLSAFVDAQGGDLHLVAGANAAIDQGVTVPTGLCDDDFDGDPRPIGPAPDVGADEYGTPGDNCESIQTVSIDGPTLGYTDTPYAFTADIVPADASRPITTTWTPAPDAGTDTVVSYTWMTTGTKAITVLVENCGGSATDTCTVTIQAPRRHHVSLPLLLRAFASTPSPSSDLIQPSDLIYQGAFAYPPGDEWAYSGHALTYYPEGNPSGPFDGYPGSLYAAGHTHHDLVGEITIPKPVISDDFAELPKASVLRPLADITGGWKDTCTYNHDCIYREVDGLAYVSNVDRVAWNLRDWYNVAGHDQDSLGWSDLDLSGARGVWHIGDRPSDDDVFHNAKTCNYLFLAPESFASESLAGKRLIAGNHRAAGAFGGSQGPTLYALAPWQDGDPPTSGQTLEALPLLYYPEIYPGCLDDPEQCHFPDYRPKDDWGGGAWLQDRDTSGVLIVGRKGLGPNCYGTPAECGGDPCDPYKGYHAYPYEPQILFYDPAELEEVVIGDREAWEVVPYDVYSPVDMVLDPACATLAAAAHDGERKVLYVTEQGAGPGGETAVHAWRVE